MSKVTSLVDLKLYTRIHYKINAAELVNKMLIDKKSSGDTINLVLIKDIGKSLNKFYKSNKDEINEFLLLNLKYVQK